MISVRVHPVQVYLIAPAMACWGLERLVQTAHPRIELSVAVEPAPVAPLTLYSSCSPAEGSVPSAVTSTAVSA